MAWRDLYQYWRGRHVGGRPPSRADIDPPLDIPKLLPNVMLVDLVGGHFRMRLAGSELIRRRGSDNTGQIIDPRTMPDRGVPAFVTFLERVMETRAPVIYSVGRSDETAFGAIGILLPLADRTGAVEMILGGVFYEPDRISGLHDLWVPGALTELSLTELLDEDR
jgi:hypothetical protein